LILKFLSQLPLAQEKLMVLWLITIQNPNKNFDLMKILIPTDDCLNIASEFENTESFKLITTFNGSIEKDLFIKVENDLKDKYPFGLKELKKYIEIRSNSAAQSKSKPKDQIAIVLNISEDAKRNLEKINFEVYYSDELNIINALNSFVKHFKPVESDYCCCP